VLVKPHNFTLDSRSRQPRPGDSLLFRTVFRHELPRFPRLATTKKSGDGNWESTAGRRSGDDPQLTYSRRTWTAANWQ